jgi:hypothetical protein
MSLPIELLTPEDLKRFEDKVVGMFNELRPTLVNAMDRFLTIEEIKEFTGTKSDITVRNWIQLGKKDRFGTVYKLEAMEFAPGQYRVLRSKLIAYGQIKGCVAVTREKRKAA